MTDQSREGTAWRCILSIVTVIVVMLSMDGLPASAAGALQIGAVRTILGGLSVAPPGSSVTAGRVKEPLFPAYGLRTGAGQRASVEMSDRSVLFINQRTDLILRSPARTDLTRGEVVVTDVRGARTRVVTGTMVASAVGTVYDVFITPRSPAQAPRTLLETTKTFPAGTTTVSVVTGTVVVSNRFGTVRVTPGHWSHVAPGTAPTAPTRHHARLDVAWRRVLLP